MPLLRPSKMPPPPELGDKTFWDYFPKRSMRRIFFLLLALGVVLFLKRGDRWSLGGLFDAPPAPGPAAPVYHIKVTRPSAAPPAGQPSPPPKSAP